MYFNNLEQWLNPQLNSVFEWGRTMIKLTVKILYVTDIILKTLAKEKNIHMGAVRLSAPRLLLRKFKKSTFDLQQLKEIWLQHIELNSNVKLIFRSNNVYTKIKNDLTPF